MKTDEKGHLWKKERKFTWFASKLFCDVWPQNLPTCLNRHHLTRREGILPNKKVSPMSESYIMWYFWGNYSTNLGNYGLRRECFLGKCKKCVWVTGRFQLSQFQLLRSQCIVPLNLVLGVQVQKHLTRLNSFRLRSKFNLKQQWDVCLPHNTWTFSNKNENWRLFVQCSTHSNQYII